MADIAAIRTDVAGLFDDLGFTQWAKSPDSIGELPAVIVSPPRSIDYSLGGFALVTLPVDVVFNAATELQSAQDELNEAMGTAADSTSVYNALHGATASSWRGALRVVGAEEPKIGEANGAKVVVVTFVVEVRSPK